MVKRVAGLALVPLLCGAAYLGCRDPTEIVVEVTTDFDCALLTGPVGVRVGATYDPQGPIAAASSACAGGYVGKVVVTPGKARPITIEVIAAVAPATIDNDGTCAEGAPGCLHARRSLPFLDSTALTVPILLQQVCAGVPCSGDKTCVDGVCVSAQVDPEQCRSDCSLHADGGVDAGPGDAGDGGLDGGAGPSGCGDMSGLQAGAVWPMHLGCPGHTGLSRFGAVLQPKLTSSKSFTMDGGIPRTIAIDAANAAYVLAENGELARFDLQTVSKTWEVPLQGTPLSSTDGTLLIGPTGTVYAGDDTQIFAIDPLTGAVKGTPVDAPDTTVRSTLTPGPGAAGRLYFSGPVSQVDSVDTLNGLEPGPTSSTLGGFDLVDPTVTGGKVLVGDTSNGTLWAMDADLKVLGKLQVLAGGALDTVSVGPDGDYRLLVVDYDSEAGVNGPPYPFSIARVASDLSKVVWRTDEGMHSIAQIVAITPDGTTYFTADDYNLYSVDADGKQSTTYNGSAAFPAFASDGTFYDSNEKNELVGLGLHAAPLGITLTALPYRMVLGANNRLVVLIDDTVWVYSL